MYAGESHGHRLQDRKGRLDLHKVVVLVLPPEDQSLGMVLILQDEIFSGGDPSKAQKVQFVYLILGIVAGLPRTHPQQVFLLPPVPLFQEDVLCLAVDDCKISERVIAG